MSVTPVEKTKLELLLEKVLEYFALGFAAVFIPGVLNLLDDVHNGVGNSWHTSFWLALLAGGVAAGIRAVLNVLPFSLPTFKKKKSALA